MHQTRSVKNLKIHLSSYISVQEERCKVFHIEHIEVCTKGTGNQEQRKKIFVKLPNVVAAKNWKN